jgi:hypothetical protein
MYTYFEQNADLLKVTASFYSLTRSEVKIDEFTRYHT